jgi:hypothetical protein
MEDSYMKSLVCFLLAGAVAIFSTIPLASAQVSNGMMRGFTITDADAQNPDERSHRLYRIDLTNASMTIERGFSGVAQELEGFFSVDNNSTGRSKLFGIAETPDGTGSQLPSNCADVTRPAVDHEALGAEVGLTGVNFGTEAGAAWDHTTNTTFAVYSNDLNVNVGGQQFPATMLVAYTGGGCTDGVPQVISDGVYIDGLAVGGDGTLYGTDARLTDSLYKFNFDEFTWDLIGKFDPSVTDFTNEDSGLANYRGTNGLETHLYMITEGDGPLLGRLWTVDPLSGAASLVGNITINGQEAPEDLEAFEIPWMPLEGEQ